MFCLPRVVEPDVVAVCSSLENNSIQSLELVGVVREYLVYEIGSFPFRFKLGTPVSFYDGLVNQDLLSNEQGLQVSFAVIVLLLPFL